MTVHLVCEGTASGLDNRILDRLVVQRHNLNVQIAFSGGSSGLGAVQEFLLKRSPSDKVIRVQDRDYFRTQTEADATWARTTATAFHWRRHEIENYLLDPKVLLTLFNDYLATAADWTSTLPSTEADVQMLLQTAAEPLIENHVGEILRVELLRCSTAAGSLQFGGSAAAPAGRLIADQNSWINALQREAARLCAVCTAASGCPDLQPAAIEARYETLLIQYRDPAFLSTGNFLIDMGGHELMAALAAHFREIGAPPHFSTTFLEDDLLEALDQIYQPGTLFQPDDFQELAAILGQY